MWTPPKTFTGEIVSDISQFMTGWVAGGPALKGIKAATTAAKTGKAMLRGALTEFTFFDGQEETLAEMMEANPKWRNPISAFLASSPDDSEAEARLKNAMEGMGLGVVADKISAGFLGTLKAIRASRLAKGMFGDAAERAARIGGNVRKAVSKLGVKQAHAAERGVGLDDAVQTGKKAEGAPEMPDFSDPRSAAEMERLHQELLSIKPTEADYLYTPKKEIMGTSPRRINDLAGTLKRDLGVTATPVEVSPGQWKLRVDHVPPAPSLAEVQISLRDMYAAMTRGEQKTISFGIVGPEEAAKIKKTTGLDVLLCRRELDTVQIKHAFDRHGQEMTRGQISITEQDFMRYGETILDPHNISPRKKRPGSIIHEKRYPDRTIYIAEHIAKGRTLEFKTLWKQAVGGPLVVILSAIPSAEKGGE